MQAILPNRSSPASSVEARDPRLRPPIILIGPHRSGTTWLGGVFATRPDLAYWSEPRHIWTRGNSYTPDDVLTAAHARPSVRRSIHHAFDRYVLRHGKTGLVEKTPSNCLRIPFIHAVYPDAKIVLILRDGRAVLRSADEIRSRGMPAYRIAQRALTTPAWEWPAYAPAAVSALSRKLTRRPLRYWGPRPPGWREWLLHDPPDVMLAKQWAATVSRAVEDCGALPPGSVFTVRYEELVREPRRVMADLADFLRLARAADLIDRMASTAEPFREDRWRSALDAGTLNLVRPHLEPALLRLGYAW